MNRYLALGLLSLFSLTTSCEELDRAMNPEKYMTPEERAAHQKKKEEYAQRNIQNMSTPGEAHDEARDAELAGSYSFEQKLEGMKVPMFHKQPREASYRRAGEMVLFDNGSYARRATYDKWQGDDWSMGYDEPQKIQRGQWKTDNGILYTRPLTLGGYGTWQDSGRYAWQQGGHRSLLIVDEQRAKALSEQNKKQAADASFGMKWQNGKARLDAGATEAMVQVMDCMVLWNRR